MTPRTAPHTPTLARDAPTRHRSAGPPACDHSHTDHLPRDEPAPGGSTTGGPQVSSSFDGAAVVVGISGELDAASAPMAWRKVQIAIERAARSSIVVLDLSGANFLDSLGITTLINLHQRSHRQQVELRVVAEPGRPIRRMLSLAGVDTLLTIHDSLEDARTAPPVRQRDSTRPPPVSSPLA